MKIIGFCLVSLFAVSAIGCVVSTSKGQWFDAANYAMAAVVFAFVGGYFLSRTV